MIRFVPSTRRIRCGRILSRLGWRSALLPRWRIRQEWSHDCLDILICRSESPCCASSVSASIRNACRTIAELAIRGLLPDPEHRTVLLRGRGHVQHRTQRVAVALDERWRSVSPRARSLKLSGWVNLRRRLRKDPARLRAVAAGTQVRARGRLTILALTVLHRGAIALLPHYEF